MKKSDEYSWLGSEEENGKHFVPYWEINKFQGPKGIICCVT